MPNRKEKIIIVGFGWVGQANAIALSKSGYDVSFFDINEPVLRYEDKYREEYERIKRVDDLKSVDNIGVWYIVCVGDRVLDNGEQDISAIQKALESLRSLKGGVILRSTILPEKLKEMPFDYYVPEFLHEKKAVEESLLPQYYVLGIKDESKSVPSFLDLWERLATKTFKGTPKEASHIKYISNIWNAMRIAFTNEIGNTIKLPREKDDVKDIENIIDFFFERKSYMRYGRSYGGHCLPKDTHAYLSWYSEKGDNVDLIEGIHNSNLKHRIIEEEYGNLPEWFSEWVRPQVSGRVAIVALSQAINKRIKKIFRL